MRLSLLVAFALLAGSVRAQNLGLVANAVKQCVKGITNDEVEFWLGATELIPQNEVLQEVCEAPPARKPSQSKSDPKPSVPESTEGSEGKPDQKLVNLENPGNPVDEDGEPACISSDPFDFINFALGNEGGNGTEEPSAKPKPSGGEHDGGDDNQAKVRHEGAPEKPAYVGCGLDQRLGQKEDSGRRHRTNDDGTLRKNSVYEILVKEEGEGEEATWAAAKAGEKGAKCLRIMTDDNGNILGRLVLTGKIPGYPDAVRSRLAGIQLPDDPNPEVHREATKFYDSLAFSDNPYMLANCNDDEFFTKPFPQYIQRRPGGEVQLRVLKFAGKRGDLRTYLDFKEASPEDLKESFPVTFEGSNQRAERVANLPAFPKFEED